MTDPDRTEPPLEEVAHVTLHLGRLLLQNGTDTAQVQGSVARFAGAFAFRAVLGGLQLVNAGATAAPALLTETVALAASCLLMVAAIAADIAAPLSLTKKGTTQG